jgi:hypothetical protein
LGIFDKLITMVFVGVLGALWFLTRRYVMPHQHRILIYDKLGGRVELDGIRTVFSTRTAAISFARHYSVMLPHHDFVLGSELPKLKRGIFH